MDADASEQILRVPCPLVRGRHAIQLFADLFEVGKEALLIPHRVGERHAEILKRLLRFFAFVRTIGHRLAETAHGALDDGDILALHLRHIHQINNALGREARPDAGIAQFDGKLPLRFRRLVNLFSEDRKASHAQSHRRAGGADGIAQEPEAGAHRAHRVDHVLADRLAVLLDEFSRFLELLVAFLDFVRVLLMRGGRSMRGLGELVDLRAQGGHVAVHRLELLVERRRVAAQTADGPAQRVYAVGRACIYFDREFESIRHVVLIEQKGKAGLD